MCCTIATKNQRANIDRGCGDIRMFFKKLPIANSTLRSLSVKKFQYWVSMHYVKQLFTIGTSLLQWTITHFMVPCSLQRSLQKVSKRHPHANYDANGKFRRGQE